MTRIMPKARTLRALSRNRLSWHDALAEVVDNAIDAGAKRVAIEGRTSGRLCIVDDGCGCRDLFKMLCLGDSGEHPTTESGMYGMGGTMTMLWLWGTTEIISASVEDGVIRRLFIDWETQETWEEPEVKTYPLSEWREFQLLAPHGTRIEYQPDKRQIRSIIDPANLRDLAWTFRPALDRGADSVAISLSYGKQVHQLTLPPFPRMVDAMPTQEGEVGGKRFTLRAGIIDSGESVSRAGFWLARGPRVIEHTHEPCNGYDASRFFAWVTLEGKDAWVPALNKNALVDEDRLALFETLTRMCDDTLAKAEGWATDIEVDSIESEVTAELAHVLHDDYADAVDVKAKRTPTAHPGSGTVPPGSGGIHARTAQAQHGTKVMGTPRPRRSSVAGVRFRLETLDTDQPFHVTLKGKQLTVSLNKQLAIIQKLAQEDERSALKALAIAVAMIHITTHDEAQAVLPTMSSQQPEEALRQALLGWDASLAREIRLACA